MLRIVVHLREDVLFIDDADDAAALQHGKLRHVVELHTLVGGEHPFVRAHRGDRVVVVAPADQVAQVAIAFALDEALVEHPEIVVDLGKIFIAAVADERDDALRRARLAAIAQRRGDQGAGGRAGHHAFLAQELAAGEQRFAVGDAVGLAHTRQVAHRRHEILADAFHEPAAHLRRRLAAVYQRREYRARRISEHDFSLRRDLGEEAREARQRAARADTADHGIDPVLELFPDLGARGVLVSPRIGLVPELVDVEGAGRVARKAGGLVLVVLRMAFRDVRAGELHFGAERLEMEDFFLAHLVRHDDQQPITFLRGDER